MAKITMAETLSSIDLLKDNNPELRAAYDHLGQTVSLPPAETLSRLALLDELGKRIKSEVVHFTYVDSDMRTCSTYGTRADDIVVKHTGALLPPEHLRPQATPGSFPYFDIESNGWKAVRITKIVEIDRAYII